MEITIKLTRKQAFCVYLALITIRSKWRRELPEVKTWAQSAYQERIDSLQVAIDQLKEQGAN